MKLDVSAPGLANLTAAEVKARLLNCGDPKPALAGGGMYNFGGCGTATATITDSAVGPGNTVANGRRGGGIINLAINLGLTPSVAILTMTGGSIAGNTATIDPTIPPSDRCNGGGGLLNSNLAAIATATLTNVLVSGNVTVTGGSGGGIHNCGGTVTLNGGAVTKNQAGGFGGGIANFVGTARIGGATIGGPLAGRTVAFTLNGIPVGTATTNASGVATLANASLGTIPVGSYPSGVGASFAQNSPYLASSAAAALAITKANTTTIVQNATATYGDATAMLRATVTNTGPGSTAPVNEGMVTFVVRQGPQTICAATSGTVSNGIAAATCPLGSLNAGVYSITATYSGGPNFNGSGGTAALQVARRVLWVKATDRTVGLHQPNPPTTSPAGCLVSATATSACWLELANGSTFAPGESWSALNLASLRCQYARNPPSTNATEYVGKTYRSTAFGLSSPNYDVRYEAGTLTVVAAP